MLSEPPITRPWNVTRLSNATPAFPAFWLPILPCSKETASVSASDRYRGLRSGSTTVAGRTTTGVTGLAVALGLGAKLNMVHVPYKGAGPSVTDLLAGQTQYMFSTIPPVLPHVKAGRLKALAVAHSKRSALLPQLPTTAEGGAPGVEASSWNGVLTRAGTAPAIITRLHTELPTIMNQPELRERLAAAGVEPMNNTPDEFAKYIEIGRAHV